MFVSIHPYPSTYRFGCRYSYDFICMYINHNNPCAHPFPFHPVPASSPTRLLLDLTFEKRPKKATAVMSPMSKLCLRRWFWNLHETYETPDPRGEHLGEMAKLVGKLHSSYSSFSFSLFSPFGSPILQRRCCTRTWRKNLPTHPIATVCLLHPFQKGLKHSQDFPKSKRYQEQTNDQLGWTNWAPNQGNQAWPSLSVMETATIKAPTIQTALYHRGTCMPSWTCRKLWPAT